MWGRHFCLPHSSVHNRPTGNIGMFLYGEMAQGGQTFLSAFQIVRSPKFGLQCP
jgi:hypothetical protein